MKKLLLVFGVLFLWQIVLAQNSKQINYVPGGASADSFLTSKHSFQCRVFELTNQYRETKIMLVFITAGENGHASRNQLRTNYLLKREKAYLKKVFFAEVQVLEHFNSIVDVSALLKKLEEKYYKPQVWAVLNTDVFFNANAKK
jgi:hypothetical protein